MSPLETQFDEAITQCIRDGFARSWPPAKIFDEINKILSTFDRKVLEAGLNGEDALEVHRSLVAMYSELVPGVAYHDHDGSIPGSDQAIIDLIAKKSLAEMAGPLSELKCQETLVSLCQRGLLERDQQTGSIRLTQVGRHFLRDDSPS